MPVLGSAALLNLYLQVFPKKTNEVWNKGRELSFSGAYLPRPNNNFFFVYDAPGKLSGVLILGQEPTQGEGVPLGQALSPLA
jgi:hypothetical protein